MRGLHTQRGFTIVEISVVVLVIGLLTFVGVRAWGSYEAQKLAATQTESTSQTTQTTVAAIETTQDLDQLQSELDAIDVIGEFESELDSATTF